jgi:transcriptional regulator with XRE-family HTH domain
MPRPTSKSKSEISELVIRLRNSLGESQQAFSNRLGLALQTIARWETSGQPKGEALLTLARVADEQNQPELAQGFQDAYAREIADFLRRVRVGAVLPDFSDPSGSTGVVMMKFNSQEQRRYARMFMLLLAALSSSDPKVVENARRRLNRVLEDEKQ